MVGIGITLALQSLCSAGYTQAALWVIVAGIMIGSVSISFLRSKSVGARRREEDFRRRNRRRLANNDYTRACS